MNKTLTITLLAALASMAAQAKVVLPHIYSDGMVIQRGVPVALHGWADPGEKFEIKVTKGPKTSVTAAPDGSWRASLPALKPGKTYTITVGDATLSNVAVGDVLLCSGQSNMELPIRRVTDMFADEVLSYSNPDIRQYRVPQTTVFEGPMADTPPSAWKSVTDDAMNFSALAYFTAKALNAKTGLPVGIINASWGGTPVESWISEEYLQDYPYYINQKAMYNSAAYRDAIKAQEGRNYAAWNSAADAADPGLKGEKFYSPTLADRFWPEVDLFSTFWATDGVNPVNGTHWFRRHVNIDAAHAGQPATLRLGCIVDADSVWVNGRQVGFTSYQYPPRIYSIPAGVLREGDNVIAIRLISQSGTPHFVAEKPYKLIFGSRPYALYGRTEADEIDLTGKWKYAQGAPMPRGPEMAFYHYLPAVLYNAMIAPVIDYPVSGAVWYQGESNVSRRNQYDALLSTMIRNWRDASGNEKMPFYVVELADFMAPTEHAERAAWQQMRDIQAALAASTPGVTLIENRDLGEWNDIHPLNKKTLGERVAAEIIRKSSPLTR